VSEAPPSPEESASRSETARALLELLALLPERQRQVLHLVFYEDMTVEAAADAMGVTVGTARVHYDRAKKRMAELSAEKEAAHAGR
jgi:RNA polymerase sigma-70 factor (ECF subfamily)